MRRPRTSGIRAASKTQQGSLKRNAKALAEDPELLIPECAGECGKCELDKLLAKLKKIQTFRNNDRMLQRFAKSGGQLERGYAVMLMLANEEKTPFLGVAKLPVGEVSYFQRGKVNKEILIGVQHYDDPKFNLLAFSEIALKRRLHIYSTPNGLICTGMRAGYPKKLIQEVTQGSEYKFAHRNNLYECPGNLKEEVGARLKIRINSADIDISLWDRSASDKENLYTSLTAKTISKNPEADFDLSLDFFLECSRDECSIGKIDIRIKHLMKEYGQGKLSDKALMQKYYSEARGQMKNVSHRLLVHGGKCYEDDVSAFIDALNPSKIERTALETILESTLRPVIVESATANAVLQQFWDDDGVKALEAVVNDPKLAKLAYDKGNRDGKTPVQILREAHSRKRSKDVLAKLPRLKDLPPIAGFADTIVRIYKTEGKAEAVREVEKSEKKNTKMKAIACGLLRSMNSLEGKEWLFTKEELDYGKYLSEFTSILLKADGEEYRAALQNLLTASGSGETISE